MLPTRASSALAVQFDDMFVVECVSRADAACAAAWPFFSMEGSFEAVVCGGEMVLFDVHPGRVSNVEVCVAVAIGDSLAW